MRNGARARAIVPEIYGMRRSTDEVPVQGYPCRRGPAWCAASVYYLLVSSFDELLSPVARIRA